MSENKRVEPMAVPWYENKSDYDFIFSMLAAPGAEDTEGFEGYLASIEALEKKFQRRGLITRRVPIYAATIKAWCDRHKTSITREALNAFMLERLIEIDRNNPSN
jgi:hypothetical protein